MCGYICGRPKQVGAVTQTYCCDHSRCFPLSDCMWNVCGGVSQMMKRRRQRLVLREMRVEKEVEQFLLRYGSQQTDVSLLRAFPIPHAGQLGPGGQVDAFF